MAMASSPILISSSPGRGGLLLDIESPPPDFEQRGGFLSARQNQKTNGASTALSTLPTSTTQSRPQSSLESHVGRTTVNPTPSLSAFWSDDDDMVPPPSNQNAFVAEREEREQQRPSQLHHSKQNTKLEIGVHEPEVPRPMIESTKQLARKRRQKKTGSEKQAVLAKGRVTKVVRKEKAPHRPQKAETVSRHFPAPEPRAPLHPGESAGLEPATWRRTDWTPPKDSKRKTFPNIVESHGSFQNLLETFGRTEETESRSTKDSVMPIGDVLQKRKVIEPVAGAEGASKTASPRPKATKKKARTLTGLATAAYASEREDKGGQLAKPARASKNKAQTAPKFLSYDGKDKVITRRGTGKLAKSKNTTSKLGEVVLPILLSPSQAMKQARNQDFVFGTSSQLAREQSPSILEDVQAAIQASLDDDTSNSRATNRTNDQKQNRLWMASARNQEGDLLEIINLVDVTEIPEGIKPAANEDNAVAKDHLQGRIPTPADVAGLTPMSDEVNAAPIGLSTPAATARPMPAGPPSDTTDTEARDVSPQPHYDLYTDAQLSREITSYGFKPIKRRAAMIALLDECWASKHGVPSGTQGFSTTSSTSAPRKNKATEYTAGADAPPKKPRGRPKKAVAAATATATENYVEDRIARELGPPPIPRIGQPKEAAVECSMAKARPKSPKPVAAPTPRRKEKRKTPASTIVIADSESEPETEAGFSPSRSPSLSDTPDPFSPPGAIDLSPMPSEEVSEPTPSTSLSLSTAITKAVISVPRSTDLMRPSWHEKMLMYDPITLEDLTEWLNSGQLARVGWDKEVALPEVKKWCESQSICCFMRVTSRGQERKRLHG